MQRIDAPRTLHTLSMLYPPNSQVRSLPKSWNLSGLDLSSGVTESGVLSNSRMRIFAQDEYLPQLDMRVPDKTIPGGVLEYTIKPVTEYGTTEYRMYYDGQRVLHPGLLFASFGSSRPIIFDESLGPLLRQRIYHDLSIGETLAPIAFASALARTDTPPPQYFEQRTPVVGNAALEERKTPIVRSALIEDRIAEAHDQIRGRIATGTQPVMLLDDRSGHYTAIVDNITNQVHVVGYSLKLKSPWHYIFQLNEGVDPVSGPYEVPVPHVVGRNLIFDTRHTPYMKLLYTKDYGRNGELSRLEVRNMLGKLDERTRRDTFGPGRIPGQSSSGSSNVHPLYLNEPDWLRTFKESERLRSSNSSLPRSTQLPPLTADVIPPKRGKTKQPAPGDYGWRAQDLIASDSVPEWIQQASTPWERQRREPRPVELGWDKHGLPKPLTISRPVHYESGLYDPSRLQPVQPDEPEAYQQLFYVSNQPQGYAIGAPSSSGVFNFPQAYYSLI